MLLPTKHLPPHRALLSTGGEVLRLLDQPKTVSKLWHEFKQRTAVGTNIESYDWFVLTLTFLNAIRAIEMKNGKLERVHP
jgi:hypothetical protein